MAFKLKTKHYMKQCEISISIFHYLENFFNTFPAN